MITPVPTVSHQQSDFVAFKGWLNLKSTECYSYFFICSSGIIQDMIGFVANPNSDFDPDYITEILNIKPFDTKKMGTLRRNGNGIYPFSDWSACKQKDPIFDVEMQCLNIVRILKEKVPILLDIKKMFDVSFGINIVPNIYNKEPPSIGFNKEIIEFCYLTGTEIDIDIYVCDKE
jgi:hypothetical protein